LNDWHSLERRQCVCAPSYFETSYLAVVYYTSPENFLGNTAQYENDDEDDLEDARQSLGQSERIDLLPKKRSFKIISILAGIFFSLISRFCGLSAINISIDCREGLSIIYGILVVSKEGSKSLIITKIGSMRIEL